jgi:hypothetical protein
VVELDPKPLFRLPARIGTGATFRLCSTHQGADAAGSFAPSILLQHRNPR